MTPPRTPTPPRRATTRRATRAPSPSPAPAPARVPSRTTSRTTSRTPSTRPDPGPGPGLTRAGYQRQQFAAALLADAGRTLTDGMDIPTLGADGNNKIGTAGRCGMALVYSGLAYHDCPGRTEACARICYAERFRFLDAAAKRRGARHLYSWLSRNNPEMLREMIGGEIARLVRRASIRRIPALVRIHEAGDFLSVAHVETWQKIAEEFPGVTFWFYTRSYRVPGISEALDKFARLPNVHGRKSYDPGEIPDDLGAGTHMPAAIINGTQFGGRTRKGPALVPGTVNCAEQITRGAIKCVDCGACWAVSRPPIRFLEH